MKTTPHPANALRVTQLQNWLLSKPEIMQVSVENAGADIFVCCQENQALQEDKSLKDKTKLWSRVFDIHYEKISGSENSEFNTNVWKSSYTGQEIPKEEMKEWVNTTVQKILDLNLKNPNVLEIGCGNGLILASLIDHISAYTGIDTSEHALHSINATFKDKPELKKINLFQAEASEINQIPKTQFNIVIINSVAQYFPNMDYFLSVLKNLKNYLAPDSIIFIGDVRSFPLNDIFLSDILKSRMLNETSMSDFTKLLNRQKLKESETLYDPRFFKLLPKSFDWITSVKTELRKGQFYNEMNKFRYDIVIKCRSQNIISNENFLIFDWEKDNFDDKKLQELFEGKTSFIISNISNARIKDAVKFYEMISKLNPEDKILEPTQNSSAKDPESLWALGTKYSWHTEIDWDLESGLEKMKLRCFKISADHPGHPFPKLLISEISNRAESGNINPELKLKLNQNILSEMENHPDFKSVKFISQDIFKLVF